MNVFQKAVNNIKSGFASYTEVTNSASVEINPMLKSLEQMNYRPRFKSVDNLEYLTFGASDDVDIMIDKLMYKSATHSGIITKKAKMITGSGLSVDSQLIGTKNARLNTLIKHAGGSNVGLYQLITKSAFEYTKSGACGIIVDYGKPRDGKVIPDGIVKFTAVPARAMRFARPNDAGEFTHMIYKKSFKSGALVPDAESIPLFDPFAPKVERQIIYVKNPYSILDSYGLPNWIGAFNFIEADFEFGVQIENAAKNGFTPKTHITMIGRNMSKDERKAAADNIQDKMSGSRSDQVLVSFVSREAEKPQIDLLDSSHLDKTIETMSRLNDAKILTAHNITSPTLFGVMTSGQTMGGTGTEMISAFNLFKATEIIPDRKVIIDAFSSLFDVTELVGVELEIIDEDINVDFKTKPVEGGNADKNPNANTNKKDKETK
tara:strand:+ start:536 stop:1834 length:1299 start_codon:yes stop_codon:yes gene_type:complete